MSILDLKHSNEILVRICCFGTLVTYSWWSVWVFCGNDLAWNSNVSFAGCNPEAWRIHTVRTNQIFFCFLQGGTWFIYFFQRPDLLFMTLSEKSSMILDDSFNLSLFLSRLSCKARLIPCTCLTAALENISLMPMKWFENIKWKSCISVHVSNHNSFVPVKIWELVNSLLKQMRCILSMKRMGKHMERLQVCIYVFLK